MNIKPIFITLLLFYTTSVSLAQVNLKKTFGDAEKQTDFLLREVEKANTGRTELQSPRTLQAGELKLVPSRDWTSGFFSGELWYLYEYTRDEKWKQAAELYMTPLEKEKTNATTHDMGFKIYCSYGNAFRLTKTPAYKEIILQSATTLCKRFNATAGVLRSWDHNRDKWDYPVIIDNMMNLELLFVATQLSGDSSFHRIAVAHANTTLKNHFRADNSSYHVVDYDTATGNVRKKNTHQGYTHGSTWARGQAWAVYGFTMCYRFTNNPLYLHQAEKAADFMLNHSRMPKDLVPYWDYDAPLIPNEERDASAAAILASGLFELSKYSKKGKEYKIKAGKILVALTQNYRSPVGENKGFILLHSTGSKPAKSEIDVPINYADYFYLEALLRSR